MSERIESACNHFVTLTRINRPLIDSDLRVKISRQYFDAVYEAFNAMN